MSNDPGMIFSMHHQIQILNNIAQVGLAEFDSKYQLETNPKHPEAILLRSFELGPENIAPTVNVIARAGVGVNNIPIEYCNSLGIPVLNTPGANANAVKELVLTGMLLACRNITQAWIYTQSLEGDDSQLNARVEKDKKQFAGSELVGKTLAVIGLGHIGLRVANTALDLGMKVIGFDAAITVKHAWQLSSQVTQAHSMQDALKNADYVSLHIPLNDKTQNLFDAKLFAQMKPGAVLLNFSRAEIVEKSALFSALKNNLHYYVCDFPSADFIGNQKIICLPHLGASTLEAEENCAVMAAQQIKSFLEHGEIKNSVNFPEVLMPRSTGFRLAIVNANIPNMLAQISSCFSQQNINIIDMINKSRNEIAYTLIDLEHNIDEVTLTQLKNIQGVIRVRKIQEGSHATQSHHKNSDGEIVATRKT